MKDTKKPPHGRRPRAVQPSGGLRAWRAGAEVGERDRRGGGDRSEADPAGLGARRMAVQLIEAVLVASKALDDAIDAIGRDPAIAALEPRDRGFARLIAATVLRRLGTLNAVISHFMERPIPIAQPRPRSILLSAAAQILMIGTPAHAAINLAVEQCRRDPKAERFDKLANAVLRKVAKEGPAILATLDTPRIDIPDWLWSKWVEAYGSTTALRIASASLEEAPLDLTTRSDAQGWAERLGGTVLATGSIRLSEAGRIEELAGYTEGAWWVQDAAAALPPRLLGDVAGAEVADLCAAPGGKTLALAASGARVTAVDLSEDRLERLTENVSRLGLGDRVATRIADLLTWDPDRSFDAVLLDAPCLSTGTIRRHPDLLHLKRPSDLGRIVTLQGTLLDRAARMVKPGGLLVYCVCSLEPEEGEGVVEAFLSRAPEYRRRPIVPADFAGSIDWITRAGDLRTLPYHEPSPGMPGMDGFYAARLIKNTS